MFACFGNDEVFNKMKQKTFNLSEIGKKSRAAGQRFEKRVREDLIKKGWIVDKWTNNVEFYNDEDVHDLPFTKGKLVPAKPKFVFNPAMKRRVMMGNSSGFPDFIIFKRSENFEKLEITMTETKEVYEPICLMGIESKMNGYLDKDERAKCKWLIENRIFSKILIAQKGLKSGEIIYIQFKIS